MFIISYFLIFSNRILGLGNFGAGGDGEGIGVGRGDARLNLKEGGGSDHGAIVAREFGCREVDGEISVGGAESFSQEGISGNAAGDN